MQFRTSIVAAILAMSSAASAACGCSRNEDAGRWQDTRYDPSTVVAFLVDQNGGCFRGNGQGNLCVSLQNPTDELRDCMKRFAQKEQSYHSDWFLWTSIQCTAGGARGQISMTL